MNDNRRVPTAFMLMIRIAIGAYLIYTAYQVFTGDPEDFNWFFYVACTIFVIVGIAAIFMGVKDLIKGRYVGGPADPGLNDSATDVVDGSVVEDNTVISEENNEIEVENETEVDITSKL